MYIFFASLSIISLTLAAYFRGRKGVLENMGAIAIIDGESKHVLFASKEAKTGFPPVLDRTNEDLYDKLMSEYLSVPYQYRGKQCRLFYLSSDKPLRADHNGTEVSLIHTLIQSIPDAIGLTDHKMVYQACNQAFVSPLGISRPEDLLGKRLEEVASQEVAEKYALSDKMVLDTGEAFRIVDEIKEDQDGLTRWIDARKFRFIHPSSNKPGLFILARDITEVELVKKELNEARDNYKKLSMLDSLTQISNRRMFDEHLQTEWMNHSRNGKPLSLMLCDIDKFKKLNDVYGHIHGDKVLSLIASSFDSLASDPLHSVFRYGGEEFAFILSDTDKQLAREFAEQVHEVVASIFEKHRISNIECRW